MTETEALPAARAGGRESLLKYAREHPNLVRLASVTLFGLLWEFFGRRADPLFMTYPTAIAKAAIEMTRSGELPEAMLLSFVPFIIGLAISLVAGIAIGLLIGQFQLLEYTIDPYINALVAIPRVALVPLIIAHFGLVLALPDWQAMAARLKAANTAFVIAPQLRFAGQPGEQHTMFFCDPFGNPMEIKGFESLETLYQA